MASYCIHCGVRQAISESHHCNSCELWTSPFELDNDAFGRLWSAAIKTVIEDFGIPAITWNRLVVAGAAAMSSRCWFDPTPPGSLTLSLSRPPEEICLSLIHEMGHAMLSLSQVSEYSLRPRVEELIVNGAADVICRRFAIPDYVARMRAVALPACVTIEELGGVARSDAMRVAGQLLDIMGRHPAADAARWHPPPLVPLTEPGQAKAAP